MRIRRKADVGRRGLVQDIAGTIKKPDDLLLRLFEVPHHMRESFVQDITPYLPFDPTEAAKEAGLLR